MSRRRLWMAGLLLVTFSHPEQGHATDPAFSPEQPLHDSSFPSEVENLSATRDFAHSTGRPATEGWSVDHRRDRAGYLLSGLRRPLFLEPGFYRVTYVLKRGQYPKTRFLREATLLVRMEITASSSNKPLAQRDIQWGDFEDHPHWQKRWVEMWIPPGEGVLAEFKLFWYGRANGAVDRVVIERYEDGNPSQWRIKADRLAERLREKHLVNGFVVSRKADGSADEQGDALTYTALYTASLAWKYGFTKDTRTRIHLEEAVKTLHSAVTGPIEDPLLVRFIDEKGNRWPKPPSKDVYTMFFFAYSTAYPFLKNEPLKKQMRADLVRLSTSLLEKGLAVRSGDENSLHLTPYLTADEIRDGVKTVLDDTNRRKSILKTLKRVYRYTPFSSLWPELKAIIKAVEKRDENALVNAVVPTANEARDLLERLHEILSERRRGDVLKKSSLSPDDLDAKWLTLVTRTLAKLPSASNTPPFRRLSDLTFNANHALIVLHIMCSTLSMSPHPMIEDYYQNNLFQQDALLRCALDWLEQEEDFVNWTAGKSLMDRTRRGYLSTLSLAALIQNEKNGAIRFQYKSLLIRQWQSAKFDDNPLLAAFALALAKDKSVPKGLIHRALSHYPEEPVGFGERYWKKRGEAVADKSAGGLNGKGYSREPLPVSMRPRDSFVWQRNSRQLRGDEEGKEYAGVDYLFLYWFSRYYHLI